MFPVVHPEVLATDWLAPVLFGRERDVAEVVRRLDPPSPAAPPPWIVGVAGASGAGSSTVGRRAAREVADRLRELPGRPSPRLLRVRLAGLRGPHGVATALLQNFDPGFDGRGFPVAEIIAGWLRRLRREQQPFVLLLDDAVVGGPELGPVLRALMEPDRFLPEGESGLPPWWTIVAGTPEGLATVARSLGRSPSLGPLVELRPYPPTTLANIVRDRSERVLGQPLPAAVVDRLVARAIEDGGGSHRAVDLLRRELLAAGRARGPGFLPRSGEPAIRIEPSVVDAIGRASAGAGARLGVIRATEARLARAAGIAPLPTTTLWRRIVRLEQAGYVRREIRTGGSGGSRSVLRLLTPIDEWVTVPTCPQSRRDAGLTIGAEAPGLEGAGRAAGWSSAPVG